MIKRTKTGCISCRIRRVKCDEAKPQCLRCQSAKRTCDGYLPEGKKMSRRQMMNALCNFPAIGPASRVLATQASLPPPAPSLPFIAAASSSTSSPDLIYFDYFRRVTAPNTDSFIPSMFWGQDLLQLAHIEPAIWHATLALGALHRRWELPFRGVEMETLIRNATIHYVKAMALARNLDSPTKLLALGLPLIASANMLGLWSESHMHILSGFRILAQNRNSVDSQRIAATLTRMDMQSFTYSESVSPYPFAEAAALQGVNQGLNEEDAVFNSYSQAASTLFALIRQLMVNDTTFWDGVMDDTKYKSVNSELLRNLEHFERMMAEFEARYQGFLDEHASVSIRVYHTWLRLIFNTRLFGPEIRYDECLGYLQLITTLVHTFIERKGDAKSLQLSLEPAVVLPLFDVGKRCRHPALRRHSLKLMKAMNRHEGMWRSDGAAVAIAGIMAVEEEGYKEEYEHISSACKNYCTTRKAKIDSLSIPWRAWSSADYVPPTDYSWEGIHRIPERQRVSTVKVTNRFESRELHLQLIMSALDPDQPYETARDLTVNF